MNLIFIMSLPVLSSAEGFVTRVGSVELCIWFLVICVIFICKTFNKDMFITTRFAPCSEEIY